MPALLALLEGFSRVYIGVHYLHDVVAGLVVGAAVTVTVAFVLRPLARHVVVVLVRTPLRVLLTTMH